MKHLGGLTLGHPLRLQGTILDKQFGALRAIPSLLTVCIAAWFVMDYSAHGYLLYQSSYHVRSGGLRMAR
jgi:hypothetical protein